MKKILVIGVDTVVGANVALFLGEKYQVSTIHPDDKFDIVNCDALDPADAPRSALTKASPDWVIYCGPAARSSWDPATTSRISDSMVDVARDWASACADQNVRFLMVSSDAVFTGPWMFHNEESVGFCQSLEAATIRATEDAVREAEPHALILRTNAYGWSADPARDGWLENLLSEVELRRVVDQDAIRHSNPILATDLAAIIERACLENLSGTFHVGGAERVNPLQFTQRVANQFSLPWLALKKETSLAEVPQEFGAGETSLQTKEIRKALCVAMPLISECLTQLFEQSENGYREKLAGSRTYRTIQRAA